MPPFLVMVKRSGPLQPDLAARVKKTVSSEKPRDRFLSGELSGKAIAGEKYKKQRT